MAFFFLVYLYLFLLSIQLMGAAFKFFGRGFAETLIQTTSSPLVGLFIGLLATSVTQSSSSTTSIVVGLVASGALTLHNAVPIVMGANIGTTVTNIIVSLGYIGRRDDFCRAFSASLVHDNFNVLSVLIFFPLQYYTRYLEKISLFLSGIFKSAGGLEFASPLKLITAPVAEAIADTIGHHPWIILPVALILLFLSLHYMVRYMKALIMSKAEVVFERTIFKTHVHGFLFGMLLTALVQSSSVTTSLMVPLVGAGLIDLERVFPYTMGANVGTTITAMLAAMAIVNPTAVAVAFSHLMFNVSGIAIFWWIQFVPIKIARIIASYGAKNRILALVYIGMMFYIIPLVVIYLMR
ncbi:MAG TPA: Na/Pi symporter [archaeon]|nr:Na/Pi symporter [archaeon]